MRVCNCISHLTWVNIRFHGDGNGDGCSSESYDFTEDFFYVAISSLSLIIVLIFTAMGCRGLFLLSHRKAALIVASISTFVYAFLFLCIWANLTVRLFVAFRESVFKINHRQQIGYKITFFFLLLNAFATSS